MPTKATFKASFRDYSDEATHTLIHIAPSITQAGTTASATQLADLLSAIQGVAYPSAYQGYTVSEDVKASNSPATVTEAQREAKLLISYTDNVTLKRFVMTIGCVDKSNLQFVPNTDIVSLSVGAPVGLVQQLENTAKSPDGNAITVLEMRFVGRNS